MIQAVLSPRPAATLILAREAAQGIEVFLLRGSQGAAFAGGAYVFPGGAVDASDHDRVLAHACAGIDDAAASRLLKLERGGLAYWVAAIRECFEEAGLLLAYDGSGDLLALDDRHRPRVRTAARAADRGHALVSPTLCRDRGLRLALDQLAYFSHWITQQGRPRRFDTRFFVAVAPGAQTPSHDRGETVENIWIRPADALERHRRGELESACFPPSRRWRRWRASPTRPR